MKPPELEYGEYIFSLYGAFFSLHRPLWTYSIRVKVFSNEGSARRSRAIGLLREHPARRGIEGNGSTPSLKRRRTTACYD